MKSFKWRPDFIIALMAVVIGLLTMVVYIYQARVMSKQLHASVWPYVEVTLSQGEHGAAIFVTNKGVGPARVKTSEIVLDGKAWRERDIDSLMIELTGRRLNRTFTTVGGSVLMAGEKVNFLSVPGLADALALDSALRHHRLSVRICYCSIYEDCWIMEHGENISCDECPAQ